MDITYTLRGIVFEWDSQKAATNLRKHGIGFKLACEVFFDPFVRYVDEELIGEELREKAIGLTANSGPCSTSFTSYAVTEFVSYRPEQ